jgi:hypothetical protein
MKRLVVFGVIIFTLISPSVVVAGDFGNNELSYAPPQLDQAQSARWINALPISRVYLARLYNIPQKEAEFYGAIYQLPVCGLSQIVPTDSNNPKGYYGELPISDYPPDYLYGSRWDREVKYIEPFIPIPINTTIAQETYQMPQIDYLAPSGLSYVERVRWGQALPTTRPYLARLWGISQEEAEEYGAKY